MLKTFMLCLATQAQGIVCLMMVPKMSPCRSSTLTLYGMNRKARRLQKKQGTNKSRPAQFYDLIDSQKQESSSEMESSKQLLSDLSSVPLAKAGKAPSEQDDDVSHAHSKMKEARNEDLTSAASVSDARRAEAPEVSTVVVDEATGIERIAQGKAVMDVVTRKAVRLYDDPNIRLAQMFPGVPPEVRERCRYKRFYDADNDNTVMDLVQGLKDACYVDGAVPEHPQITNEGVDYVLANRDYLGFRMKKLLGRLKLRAQSLKQLEKAKEYRALFKHFFTLEDHISAPFRQMILDAEKLIGPNFGNLDVQSYLNGPLVNRAANYLALKATVAHWEKKVRDAEYVQSTPLTRSNYMQILSVGDPKRYLPDPPIIYRLNDCVKVCSMAQTMSQAFVNQTALFNDLPPELRFLEHALYIKGGTQLRRYMLQTFCPNEQITPQALREGLRRLDAQFANLQIDPYGDFKNTLGRLCEATAQGTPDQHDPYQSYLYNHNTNGPGFFQTYTFNHDKNSMVRFLDSAKNIEEGGVGQFDDITSTLTKELTGIIGFYKPKAKDTATDQKGEEEYTPPKRRAAGRPHNLGWLDLLQDPSEEKVNDNILESDNWRELKK